MHRSFHQFLHEGIPFSTGRTLAQPLRRGMSTGLTKKGGFSFGHDYTICAQKYVLISVFSFFSDEKG
jgi:hypothetical protein